MENNQDNTKIKLHDKKGNVVGIAIVDVDRFDELNKYKWSLLLGYARAIIDNKTALMHRFIKNAQKNVIIDHKNGQRLDNRIANLRESNPQQNAQNRRILESKKSSKFMGVFYRKKVKKYIVKFKLNSIFITLGSFDDEETAAIIRDQYIAHKLPHVPLNFENKREEYLTLECPPIKTNKHNIVGVTKNSNGKFSIRVQNNDGVLQNIGTSDTIQEGCDIYDKFIINNGIKNRRLNHPEKFSNHVSSFGKTFSKEKLKYDAIDDNIGKIAVVRKIENKPIETFSVMINKDDFIKIKYYTLSINSNGYVQISVNNKSMRLHRFILDVKDPAIFIDHIDGNRLDNTRINLRYSNAQLNAQNRTKKINTSSAYMGVSKNGNKYYSTIAKNHVKIYSYCNNNEEYCARARDIHILTNMKDDHYKLNFAWTNDDLNKWKQILNEQI